MNIPSNVLILGASGVIGGAIATAFGQQRWTVGLHYHQHRSAALELATTIQAAGGKGVVYQGDVTEPSQVHNIVERFTRSHHSLQAFVWAVGISSSALVIRTSPENWERTLQTNLTGAFYALRAIAPVFAKQKSGVAILVGSLSSERGLAGESAYAASKAGLIGLMRTAAQEWGALNIRVNVIFPGWHFSPLSEPGWRTTMESDPHLLLKPPSLKTMALSVYHLAVSPDISGQVWNLDSRIG